TNRGDGDRVRCTGRRDPGTTAVVARAPGSGGGRRSGHADRVPRLEELDSMVEPARLEFPFELPRPFPDVAERQPQHASPELRVLDLQRLRDLSRQPRLLVHDVLREAG